MPLTSPKGTMPKTSTTPPTEKLLGLEALRFFAAFAVLIWHYQHFSYVADTPVDFVRNQLPFYGLFYPFYEAGVYGVWLFWCISGFIFFWKYRDAISGRTVGGWKFFVFRLSRLYPLHLVTLLMVALMQPIYFYLHGFFFVYQNNDVQHFIPQLFMASDWGLLRSNSFNGPIWSISVEVLVYAVFFLTLRFATKSPLANVIVIAICDRSLSRLLLCRRSCGHRPAGHRALAVPASDRNCRLVRRGRGSGFDLDVEPAELDIPALLYADPVVLLFRPDGALAAIATAAGGGGKHDLFKLSSAFPNSDPDCARIFDRAASDSVLR
jgi:Acyltransferase family